MTKKGIVQFFLFIVIAVTVGQFFFFQQINETFAYVFGFIGLIISAILYSVQKQYCPSCRNFIGDVQNKRFLGEKSEYNSNQNRIETTAFIEVEYACPNCKHHWAVEEKIKR